MRKIIPENSFRAIVTWFVQIGLLVTAFVYLYANTITHLAHDWRTDDNFSHGFLIPAVSVFLIWQKKDELSQLKANPSVWGVFIVLVAMFMYILGNIGAELFVMRSSIVICLVGITFFMFGRSITKAVIIPLLYLFFMIPIPSIIWNQIAFPLQLIAAKLSAGIIQFLGITIFREGNILHLSNTTLEVVDACSGLRSLTSMLALSAAFAYISNLMAINKWVLFLSAIPIAIAVNIFRLTVTAILARYIGPETAQGFLHDLSGILVFIVALILLYALYQVMSKLEDTIPKKKSNSNRAKESK